jgi:hypothetical protein
VLDSPRPPSQQESDGEIVELPVLVSDGRLVVSVGENPLERDGLRVGMVFDSVSESAADADHAEPLSDFVG